MIPSSVIHTDSVRLRNSSTDAKEIGLTVELLPEGTSAPAGLIALTANSGMPWQYDFPAGVINGTYDVYVNGSPVQHGGQTVTIRVIRGGIITPSDTSFAF